MRYVISFLYVVESLKNSEQYAILPLKDEKHFDGIVIAWKK